MKTSFSILAAACLLSSLVPLFDTSDKALAQFVGCTPGATVYRDGNYQGYSLTFGSGPCRNRETRLKNLCIADRRNRLTGNCSINNWNDEISSVKIEFSSITLYQDSNYEGRCLSITRSVPDLRVYGFLDAASSVKLGRDPRCQTI
ncbi:MAG: hypothetical protein WBV73_03380 [Phormidium sp.]